MDNKVFNKKDIEIMSTFFNERCINKRTQYGYHNSFSLYIQYTGLHLRELLFEANVEEEEGIRWKKTKLKEKLIGFRGWLQKNINTVHLKCCLIVLKLFIIILKLK